MKKRMFMILGAVLAITGTGMAQSVQYKHDSDNYNQIASMEYKQYTFTPRSDYYSKIRKTILFVSFDVPGNGWHEDGYFGTGVNVEPNIYAGLIGEWDLVYNPDGYVDENWRKMAGLRAPAVLSAGLQKNYITDEDNWWQNIRNGDLLTIADRSGETPSALLGSSAVEVTANDRNDACRNIEQYLQQVNEPNMQVASAVEYECIQSNITNLRSAHMDDAKKAVELTAANGQLEKLKRKVSVRAKFCQFMDSTVYVPGKGFGDPDWKNNTIVSPADVSGALQAVRNLVNLNKL